VAALRRVSDPEPVPLGRPALFDTGVWTWVRDRRFPGLAQWFNAEVRAGRVLVCELVRLELIRLTPNHERAGDLARRLAAFDSVPMPESLWSRARDVQLAMSAAADHRRVPPPDLLLAAAAELARVPILHYDRDYERVAAVTHQEHAWFVQDGTLAADALTTNPT